MTALARHPAALLLVTLAGCTLLACRAQKGQGPAGPDAGTPNPKGSILAPPLASEGALMPGPHPRPAEGGTRPPRDASPSRLPSEAKAPRPLREDRQPAADTLRGHEAVGVSLEARWQWHGTPSPPNAPEVAKEAITAARERTALTVSIDISPLGRMRFALTGPAFPLPENTELRARYDRYGHVLVWPDGRNYRVLPPGTLRALLEERRVDVMPLLPETTADKKPGSLLGFETTRTEVSCQLGKLVLEQALVPGAASGAPLLCRLLVELVGVEPSSSVCLDGMLPLRADYHWSGGGKLSFVVSTLLRGQELRIDDLVVPPATAAFKLDQLPIQHAGILLSRVELFKLRSRALEPAEPADAGTPEKGVVAVNRTETLRYLLLDGVAVAWMRAKSERHVVGPRAGRYVASWRDFLGTEVEPARTVDVPVRLVLGEPPDAGAGER